MLYNFGNNVLSVVMCIMYFDKLYMDIVSDAYIRADLVGKFFICHSMAASHAEDFQIYVLEQP